MPNLIKKVLANVAQALTTAEKQQARDNIGIPKYTKLAAYDTNITDINNAARITQVGAFDILYYHDNGGGLRLAVENLETDSTHSIVVASGSSIETHNDITFGTREPLSVSFTNNYGLHQDLRIIIDGTTVGELSIQHIQSLTPSDSQLWYKV